MSWLDERLSFESNAEFNSSEQLTLDYTYKDDLWLPDLYIDNEASGGTFHALSVPNTLIRLKKNGELFISQRYWIVHHSYKVFCANLFHID